MCFCEIGERHYFNDGAVNEVIYPEPKVVQIPLEAFGYPLPEVMEGTLEALELRRTAHEIYAFSVPLIRIRNVSVKVPIPTLANAASRLFTLGKKYDVPVGVENDGEPPFSQYADLPQAMQGTEGMFKLLLSHNPTHWRREVLPCSDIDLMLAGHTHAMQGIFFGHSLAELKYPEWKGMYQEGERALYVNIGIGYVGLPFRFGAWPEITVITLRKKTE